MSEDPPAPTPAPADQPAADTDATIAQVRGYGLQFEQWLDTLPRDYPRVTGVTYDRQQGQVTLEYRQAAFNVPQALTEKMLRHGYVFLRAHCDSVVFQRVRSE